MGGASMTARCIAIGNQDFRYIRENNLFYVDKTGLISDWWHASDEVTLITRPRRFGKTLNMSMLDHFFSLRYNISDFEYSDKYNVSITNDVALQQIENKKYETVLLQRGVKKETIVNYGIAFYGKKSAKRRIVKI